MLLWSWQQVEAVCSVQRVRREATEQSGSGRIRQLDTWVVWGGLRKYTIEMDGNFPLMKVWPAEHRCISQCIGCLIHANIKTFFFFFQNMMKISYWTVTFRYLAWILANILICCFFFFYFVYHFSIQCRWSFKLGVDQLSALVDYQAVIFLSHRR